MALDPNITGTDQNDYLVATPGTNVIDAGAGDDMIETVDGDNTILFDVGSGLDTLTFAPVRSYQYAGFLEEAQTALAALTGVTGPVTDEYFGTLVPKVLVNTLPWDLRNSLRQFKAVGGGDGTPPVLGTMDAEDARQTMDALIAWIAAPSQDVIQLGEGITRENLSVQVLDSTATNFGVPSQFQVSINGQDGLIFQLGRPDFVAEATTGSSSAPPVPVTFRFADGTTVSLNELLSADPNHDPVVSMPFGEQHATQDTAFSFQIPDGTFTDPDVGDVLTLSASAVDANGDAIVLPTWLTFDPASGSFSGTPTNDDVGALSVIVTASDSAGAKISTPLTIEVANVNDVPVGVPTITGSATEDQMLTADVSGMSDADGLGTFNYQWLRNGVAISSATAATYTLGDADVGAQISVQVGYSDGHGTPEAVTSAATAAVVNVNDVPVGVPVISGTATEDQVLTADVSGISDADGLRTSKLGTFNYQWLRDGVAIDSATGSTYTLGDADVGSHISVQVGYTDGHGTVEAVASAATAAVANVNDAPLGVPTITGTATEDQTLTANTAGISDADGLGAFNYQWLRNGVAINSATAASYKLGDADVGAQISVRVGYTDGHGTPETLASTPTAAVANVNDAPVGIPTIIGTATEDQTLTANTAGISDADGLGAFNYQWLRNGVAINSATAASYKLGDADVGAQISVRVGYTDGHGTPEALSSTPTAPVANVNDPTAGVPIITGTATKDQILAANTAGISDADGLGTFNYQWLRDGAAIGGATASTYTLGGTDVGTHISVRVGFVDGHGTPEAVTSISTDAVTAPPGSPPPVDPPTGKTIVGGNGNDTLTGGAGNDVLRGNRGRDLLSGGDGDDQLYFSQDANWTRRGRRRDNGSPGHSGTGETVRIGRKGQSQDILNGGAGNDTLIGTSGSDAILLDDTRSPARQTGPRIIGIERIEAGAGNDVVDLTSRRYAYGDVTIDGGSGNDVLWSSSGNDALLGGSGNDRMDGGAGNDYMDGGADRDVINGGEGVDVLQGGSGDDELQDASGNGLLDGGSGNDRLTGGSNNALFIGGKGDDTVRLGSGSNVVAFDRGDGRDVIQSGSGGGSTLSLGAGIRLQDLAFRRSGDNLILETGNNESITFDNWYRSRSNQAFTKLQFVTEGMTGPGSSTELDDKIETFDFRKLVGAFDSARARNPGLSRWALTNSLASFHLDNVHNNSKALGGDLAYAYGTAGALAGIGVGAAQDVLTSAQFGKESQALHPVSGLKEGLVKLA